MKPEAPLSNEQETVADAHEQHEAHPHEPETITRLSRELRRARSQERRAIALGMPILLLTYAAILSMSAARYIPANGELGDGAAIRLLALIGLPESASTSWGFILLAALIGIVTVSIALVVYYFWFKPPVRDLELKLQEARDEVRSERVATMEGWQEVLWRELLQVTAVVLSDSGRERTRKTHVTEARKILEGENEGSLLEVETRINSANSLIQIEAQERVEQLRWRNLSVVIILLYIGLAISLASLAEANLPFNEFGSFNTSGQSNTYGIPPRIFFWAGLGSLAAVLYRFYSFRGVVRFDEEVRWLIARPITGIIMGALAYLALRAGFVLAGGNAHGFEPLANGLRVETGVIVAFLGGFSDYFYEGLVQRLTSGFNNGHGHESQVNEGGATS